jgi:hypothetical protein
MWNSRTLRSSQASEGSIWASSGLDGEPSASPRSTPTPVPSSSSAAETRRSIVTVSERHEHIGTFCLKYNGSCLDDWVYPEAPLACPYPCLDHDEHVHVPVLEATDAAATES